jgi:hypothetical protein
VVLAFILPPPTTNEGTIFASLPQGNEDFFYFLISSQKFFK